MRITVRLPDDLGEDVKRRTDNVSRYVEEALTEKISARSVAGPAKRFSTWSREGRSTLACTTKTSRCDETKTGTGESNALESSSVSGGSRQRVTCIGPGTWKGLILGFSSICVQERPRRRRCGAPLRSGTIQRGKFNCALRAIPARARGTTQLEVHRGNRGGDRGCVYEGRCRFDHRALLGRRASPTEWGCRWPLIAASLEHVGCDHLHTSDSDFEAYEGPMEVVFL